MYGFPLIESRCVFALSSAYSNFHYKPPCRLAFLVSCVLTHYRVAVSQNLASCLSRQRLWAIERPVLPKMLSSRCLTRHISVLFVMGSSGETVDLSVWLHI